MQSSDCASIMHMRTCTHGLQSDFIVCWLMNSLLVACSFYRLSYSPTTTCCMYSGGLADGLTPQKSDGEPIYALQNDVQDIRRDAMQSVRG